MGELVFYVSFLAVSWVGLQCMVFAYPGHTHLLILKEKKGSRNSDCMIVDYLSNESQSLLFILFDVLLYEMEGNPSQSV